MKQLFDKIRFGECDLNFDDKTTGDRKGCVPCYICHKEDEGPRQHVWPEGTRAMFCICQNEKCAAIAIQGSLESLAPSLFVPMTQERPHERKEEHEL